MDLERNSSRAGSQGPQRQGQNMGQNANVTTVGCRATPFPSPCSPFPVIVVATVFPVTLPAQRERKLRCHRCAAAGSQRVACFNAPTLQLSRRTKPPTHPCPTHPCRMPTTVHLRCMVSGFVAPATVPHSGSRPIAAQLHAGSRWWHGDANSRCKQRLAWAMLGHADEQAPRAAVMCFTP